MNVLGRKPVGQQENTEYATSSDFCRIFATDTKRLYLLSLLLTGDPLAAERCFVRALEEATRPSAVFKEWAASWARRSVIQSAIRMVRPTPLGSGGSAGAQPADGAPVASGPREIRAVAALPAFERFVFVISVLEGYSVQNCSLLLGCARAQVAAARTRALQRLGRSQEDSRERLEASPTESPERGPEFDSEFKNLGVLPVPA